MSNTNILQQAKHILCIGMPVADILVRGMSAQTVAAYGMAYNDRSVMDAAQAKKIEADLSSYNTDVVAGGSLANSACAMQALCPELRLQFVAACANDSYGKIFAEAMRNAKISLLPKQHYGADTSRSYVCTDERGERAIGRYFGDSMSAFQAHDIEAHIADADVMILEGELLALPQGYDLWDSLIALAKKHDTSLGFTLFGAEQVRHHRDKMIETIKQHAALVCGNDDELYALLECGAEGFEAGCQQVFDWMSQPSASAVISRGESPATLVDKTGAYHAAPTPLKSVVSTLGAGDAYMAGVCSGLIRGYDEVSALKLGHRVAALVLQQESGQLSHSSLQGV
jgi:sugar/nucleoside kinase (ribokinase family)